MTFTSYQFILFFLPLSYVGFLLAHRFGGWRWAINFIAIISFVFYFASAQWLVCFLVCSICFNYIMGQRIADSVASVTGNAQVWLSAGLAVNLFALCYLKYMDFFIDITNQVTGSGFSHLAMVAPIGVSFFTFIQLGYLIDAYNGQLIKHDFTQYAVFAAFFPCVTSGPLVNQREMMSQMQGRTDQAFDMERLVTGLTMFGLGLAKKVIFADSIAPMANTVFNSVAEGQQADFATAWLGSLCYALQLYFDFSGYSDMAIGLGYMFGLKLPLNFDSPFKATNISDFWRRWHMTMTRFFTSYIYSSLAMNGMRRAAAKRSGKLARFFAVAAFPSFITFLVAGVWHGAGWIYVAYGAAHGTAIAIYLGWREFSPYRFPAPFAWLLTMVTVVSGLVLFRSTDLTSAFSLLGSMWGFGDVTAGNEIIIDSSQTLSMVILMGAVTLLLPNTQQILHRQWPSLDSKPATAALEAGLLTWRPAFGSAVVSAAIMAMALASLGSGSSFLYYKF